MYVFSVLASILLAATLVGAAELTNATCTQDQWTTNSDGLSPCQLSVILEGACFNDNFVLPALPQNSQYSGVPSGASNVCQCSSVTYSVVQACAVCQGGSITPWQAWIEGCLPNHISIGSYPLHIANVEVPAWAFTNVSIVGVFETAQASSLATLAESSLTQTSTSAGSGANNSKSSSDTGAVVGGVIGGLVGLALIGIGAFVVYRRRHRSRITQPRPSQEKVDMTQPNPNHFSDTYSLTPPRLYDPADPATFPHSPVPTFTNSLLSGSTSPPPTSPGHRHGNSSGSYSGFPEI